MRQALAPSMQKAYTSHLQNFHRFCTTVDQTCIPGIPSTIMRYLASLAPATTDMNLRCHLATICLAHVVKRLEDPMKDVRVDDLLRGITRSQVRIPIIKAPITLITLRNI